jgi:hypothetical protein
MIDAKGRDFLEKTRASAGRAIMWNRWAIPISASLLAFLIFSGSRGESGEMAVDWLSGILAAACYCALGLAWCWLIYTDYFHRLRLYVKSVLLEGGLLLQVLDDQPAEPPNQQWWNRTLWDSAPPKPRPPSFQRRMSGLFNQYNRLAARSGLNAFPARKLWTDIAVTGGFFGAYIGAVLWLNYCMESAPIGHTHLSPLAFLPLRLTLPCMMFLGNRFNGYYYMARYAVVTAVAEALLDDEEANDPYAVVDTPLEDGKADELVGGSSELNEPSDPTDPGW